MRRSTLAICSGLAAVIFMPAVSALEFSESDFTDWATVTVDPLDPSLLLNNVTFPTTGGNPGGYLRAQGPGISFSYDTSGAFTYDPAAQTLGWTGFSFDYFDKNTPGEYGGFFLALMQNNELFLSFVGDYFVDHDDTWHPVADGGFPYPIDWAFFSPTTGSFPDISPTGAPITFGIMTFSEDDTVAPDVGIDNFKMTFSVPEAGSSAFLLALGTLPLAFLARKRLAH